MKNLVSLVKDINRVSLNGHVSIFKKYGTVCVSLYDSNKDKLFTVGENMAFVSARELLCEILAETVATRIGKAIFSWGGIEWVRLWQENNLLLNFPEN